MPPIHCRRGGSRARPLWLLLMVIPPVVQPAGDPAAGEFSSLVTTLTAPLRAAGRTPPAAPADDCLERLAAELDWLEHHVDRYGSIVTKQPDVWGQSRLTRHREEFEEELRRRLRDFEVRASAALRRSDQSFLGMAMALEAATDRRRGPEEVPVPSITGSTSVLTAIGGLIPTGSEGVGRTDAGVVTRSEPFGLPRSAAGMPFDDTPLALEPTLQLDQLARYLGHLQELRRINEGDDIADSPGYALNLVRIPVSILPGHRTTAGYGAEVTVIAEPLLGEDLLPVTFRSLVVNDLVDTIAPALTWCVNDQDCLHWAATITAASRGISGAVADAAALPGPMMPDGQDRPFGASAADRGANSPEPGHPAPPDVEEAVRSLAGRLPLLGSATAPSMKTRRARMPIPFSQLADVAGVRQMAILIHDTHRGLEHHPAARPCIGYAEVRALLAEELEAAYDLLEQPAHAGIWVEACGWGLTEAVRGRLTGRLDGLRCRFLARFGSGEPSPVGIGTGPSAHTAAGEGPFFGPVDPLAAAEACCEPPRTATPVCRTTSAVLAWAILVESCLLDRRLAEDIREAATARGFLRPADHDGPFFGPDPSPAARAAFAEYVRVRWPLKVFALDPVAQDQNVEDAFARRRELQIALAMAFASGRIGAQALSRFTRRLETDMATLALNRTAVGFAHGDDTFGWRFMPRVQTPPVRGTLLTLADTLCGTDERRDLDSRRLEPGQRECTAIVVMPSFVPTVTFDVRTNWFRLVDPGTTEPPMRDTMQLSRSLTAMRSHVSACAACGHRYRDGELMRLLRRVDQLDRELPLQTLVAQVPQENTAGGFELFSAGVTDLAPELLGWYGSPGIDPDATTTLFLIGRGFSVHDTSVIAGGLPVPVSLLSREVLRAEIPPGVQTLAPAPGFCSGPAIAPAGWSGSPGRTGGIRLAAVGEAESLPMPPGTKVPLRADRILPTEAPCACDGCNGREVVVVHLATPYGVTSQMPVPVSRRRAGEVTALVFASPRRMRFSFTASRSAGSESETAKVDEFYELDAESLAIRVPASFVPPAKAELQCALVESGSGATAATFGLSDPPFDARRLEYRLTGATLRNFVGDTSRPATDKTLRGAIKTWLDSRLAGGELAAAGDSARLRLTATLAAAGQEVPVEGAVQVEVVRRAGSR